MKSREKMKNFIYIVHYPRNILHALQEIDRSYKIMFIGADVNGNNAAQGKLKFRADICLRDGRKDLTLMEVESISWNGNVRCIGPTNCRGCVCEIIG